jgi:hypothetical protein
VLVDRHTFADGQIVKECNMVRLILRDVTITVPAHWHILKRRQSDYVANCSPRKNSRIGDLHQK